MFPIWDSYSYTKYDLKVTTRLKNNVIQRSKQSKRMERNFEVAGLIFEIFRLETGTKSHILTSNMLRVTRNATCPSVNIY